MTVQPLHCARCRQALLHPKEGSHMIGYGLNDRGQKVCYTCCGDIDREGMMRSGKITLYLSKFNDKEWAALKIIGKGIPASHRYKISNFPGTLVLQPFHAHTSYGSGFGGKYPIEHVAFIGPDGYEWYGRCAGHTQILHCARKKKQALSFAGVVWTTQDGRKLPLYQMEPAHLENIIRKIIRELESDNESLRKWATIHKPYIEPMQKLLDVKRRRGDPERGYLHAGGIIGDTPSEDPMQLEVTQ